jgi:hypothetical protein
MIFTADLKANLSKLLLIFPLLKLRYPNCFVAFTLSPFFAFVAGLADAHQG